MAKVELTLTSFKTKSRLFCLEIADGEIDFWLIPINGKNYFKEKIHINYLYIVKPISN